MAYVRSGSQQPTGNAVAGDVKAGKTFSNENDVDIVGTFAAQEKTVTAGTSAASVTPDSGKYLSKVTYNPTPSQVKSVAPSTSTQTVTPDSGKLLSKVTVDAINTQTKTVIASRSDQTVTPDSGKYLSRVTVNKYPDASGTYTPTGANRNKSAADMGTTNNLRYVNTAVCYNLGVEHVLNNRAGFCSGFFKDDNAEYRMDLHDIKANTTISFTTNNTYRYGFVIKLGDGNNWFDAAMNFYNNNGWSYKLTKDYSTLVVAVYRSTSHPETNDFSYWWSLSNSSY